MTTSKVVLVDPDSGIHFELKKRHLAVVRSRGTSSCRQSPKAPVSDWSLSMFEIPKLRYSQIYDYLIAISADGAEMRALKSLKTEIF